jgi:hypothetical protein
MVETAEDDPRETKPNFVEKSGDIKPPKIDVIPRVFLA